jgi:hypothetical protein
VTTEGAYPLVWPSPNGFTNPTAKGRCTFPGCVLTEHEGGHRGWVAPSRKGDLPMDAPS